MPSIGSEAVINITVTREDLGVGIPGFGVLNIAGTSTTIPESELIRFYESITEVGNDFAATTEEFKAAETYFSQSPRGQKIAISRLADVAATSAKLVGLALVSNLAYFQAITDGEFKATIDGDAQDITGLNFTAAVDLDGVAAIIETALQAVGTGGYTLATCTYDSLANKFTITSGTTGATSTIAQLATVTTPAGTDISGPTNTGLNMQSGVVTNGVDAASDIVSKIQAIQAASDEWYGLMFTNGIRDNSDVIDTATYIESQFKIFGTVSNNAEVLDSSVSDDIISQLQALTFARTFANYSSFTAQYSESSVFARMFGVDFQAANSTITMNLKNLPGITVESITQNQLDTIKAKGGNVFVKIGGHNVYMVGQMVDGEFIDIIQNVDWLNQAMRNDVFALLVNAATKIPFNDPGIRAVEQAMRISLDQGVLNTMLTASRDSQGNLLPAYEITVPRLIDINPIDRANRELKGVSFIGRLAGAIHTVTITGVVTVSL